MTISVFFQLSTLTPLVILLSWLLVVVISGSRDLISIAEQIHTAHKLDEVIHSFHA